MAESVAVSKEALDLIIAAGGDSVKLCYQCGLCNTTCPWNLVKDFMVRKLVREAQLGVPEIESDRIWQCATCGKCVASCPRGVKITEIIVSLRKIATEYNMLPQTVRGARGSLSGEGNPWGGKRKDRANWAQALAVKTHTEDTEVLYFPCCTQIYDQRSSRIAAATVNIFQRAGLDFGIIGTEGACCGESIRKAGEEGLYRHLARENIKTFIDHGVTKIVVSSPHCYQALSNDYPEFMVKFEVIHIAQLLTELINQGRLKFSKQYHKKVAYHDPCYLGRHNGIYDAPRDLLRQIPGLELVELAGNREDSFCCGGGGARIWMETPKGERFSDLRLQQAIDAGASVLATFCPYCILNFEDSRLNLGEDPAIEIKDVTEIIREMV